MTVVGTLVLDRRPLIGYGDSLLAGAGAQPLPFSSWHFKLCRSFDNPYRFLNFGVAGEGLAAIATRFRQAITHHVAEYPQAVYVLQGGFNSLPNGEHAIISLAMKMVCDLERASPSAQFFFMGIPNGETADEMVGGRRYHTIVQANAGLAQIMGPRFADVRTWLISEGLTSVGLSPTAGDLADIAADMIPRQLRATQADAQNNRFGVHWNNFGHRAVAIFARLVCDRLGIN